MTQPQVRSPPPEPPAPGPPPRGRSWAWRVLAVAVIFAATVAVAHYLRNVPRGKGPSPFGGQQDAAPAGTDAFAPVSEAEAAARDEEGRRLALADLRARMAGVLMHAADEDGPYADPGNQDPQSRRRFLADLFGVPYDYPQGQVSADLAPKDAKVIVVMDSPQGTGSRMAIMRVPGDIHVALSAVHNHYVAAGWKAPDRLDPSAQTDQGWLVRFTKGRSERIVYARPRAAGDETLVAVYDEPR